MSSNVVCPECSHRSHPPNECEFCNCGESRLSHASSPITHGPKRIPFNYVPTLGEVDLLNKGRVVPRRRKC